MKKKELENLYNEIYDRVKLHEKNLEERNIKYLLHLDDNQHVLLLNTNASEDQLNHMSNKVYYTAPSSQIFLFFTTEEKRSIFNTFNNRESQFNDYQGVSI